VLHWSSKVRVLVGWSEVMGSATVVPQYSWQPFGTYEGALPGPRTTEGWVAPLAGYIDVFTERSTLATLQPLLHQLMELNAALETKHGKPTYFPFYRYAQIRTQQAYFVKFPVELFDLIPGIESAKLGTDLEVEDADIPEDFQPVSKNAPHGRTTRVQDPRVRAAIERRALDVALAYYDSIGGMNPMEAGKPYDIAVTVDGIERHCEVKGSSMFIDTVELTINEVNHDRGCASADLIVVDGIEVSRDKATGEIHASGGRRRVWKDWSPADEALTAHKFAYLSPQAES